MGREGNDMICPFLIKVHSGLKICKDVQIPKEDSEGLDDSLELKVDTVRGRRRRTRGAKNQSGGRLLRPIQRIWPIRGLALSIGLQIRSSQSLLVQFLQGFLQGFQEVRGKSRQGG